MNISEIRRFVFEYANSNMYVIAKDKSALVIDPNISEDALKFLHSNNVSEITVLLTHEHYDHTSGLIWLCGKFRSTVICHEETAKSLRCGKNSRPIMMISNLRDKLPRTEIKSIIDKLPQNYKYVPDITFESEYDFKWQEHFVKIISTPGHSRGSCCIEIDDNVVATGDSLILNTPVIVRLSGGSCEQYERLAKPYLNALPSGILILPGHGKQFFLDKVKA